MSEDHAASLYSCSYSNHSELYIHRHSITVVLSNFLARPLTYIQVADLPATFYSCLVLGIVSQLFQSAKLRETPETRRVYHIYIYRLVS